MYSTKKLGSKLLYKKLLYLKKDVKNSDKILKFKKKKWQKFQQILLKSKKKRFYDPVIYSLSNFKSFFNKKFKYNLHNKQRLSFFYGKLKKSYLKKLLKEIFKKSKISKKNLITLLIQQLENRLDTILRRTHFAYSLHNARQLIAHKKVYSIPLILIIGWRGSPNIKDEPQHEAKGKITQNILKLLNIDYTILKNKFDLNRFDKKIKN